MKNPKTATTAFSLVEVTMALGVISFCLVGLFGLLPIGLKSNQAAIEQTAANGIFSTVIADLRATTLSSSGTSSQQFKIPIPSNPTLAGSTMTLYFDSDGKGTDDSGAPITSPLSNSHYVLKVSFVPNKTTKSATLANMTLSWPAAADPKAPPSGSVQTFLALDRN